jgi:UDP-2,3-diacylglucosamine pyrophosphatase LpxH
MQWVKTRLDDDKLEQVIRETVVALTEDVKGRAPLTKAPAKAHADLLAVYPFGDPHFGMYAWAKEVGEDFDLDIARKLTLGAVDRLVQAAPPAETAILLPLGDIFHMDDQTNRTPGHGHQLDADGRFVKVLHVGIQTFRHAVLRCLEKHQRVIVRFVQGNHDPHAVWALAFSIAAYFESDPRVEVDLSPAKHWFYRFGKVLIGSTHGDTTKPEQLLGVMASDRAEDWGQTKHRYWYTGHVHHQSVREYAGVTAESFRTLAAKDAYAAGHGYRAGRDMRCIVHHRDHGEIERHRCDVGMLEPA